MVKVATVWVHDFKTNVFVGRGALICLYEISIQCTNTGNTVTLSVP